MRNGIYSFYVTLDGTALKGIALVENDAVAGFNRSHIYFLERLANVALMKPVQPEGVVAVI
jgi:hypothetical protein